MHGESGVLLLCYESLNYLRFWDLDSHRPIRGRRCGIWTVSDERIIAQAPTVVTNTNATYMNDVSVGSQEVAVQRFPFPFGLSTRLLGTLENLRTFTFHVDDNHALVEYRDNEGPRSPTHREC